MILRLENGEIALPKDFRFDITANHPFFSNDGTASTPATIPSTPENRAILGSPENYHRVNRFTRHLSAVISHGVFSKRCRMVVDTASLKGGVTTSLALEESEMYADIQDRKLKEIITPTLFVVQASGGQTAFQRWTQYLTGKDGPFVFLPVAADAADTESADATGSKRKPQIVLNKMSGSYIRISGVTVKRNDETYSAPEYYGMAPFLRLSRVLEMMFTSCGYTVSENVFSTDARLKDIVVLHNTADALCGSLVSYNNTTGVATYRMPWADFVPSVTVGDMIQWIHDKFGAFVTMRESVVRIRLFSSVADGAMDADLTPYLREGASVTWQDPVMLRTGCSHDIESSAPAAETLEGLRATYPSMVSCNSVSEAAGTGLFHVLPLGKFYFRNAAGDSLSMVGTDGYDYTREMGMEEEEMTADDSFVPMVLMDGEYMPYIGETVRRHWDLDDKNADAEQRLMVCYVRNNGSRNYGTLYPFDPSGNAVQDGLPELTPEGLMPEFWSRYRDLRMNAAPVITAQLDIPLHVLSTMDLWTPKLLDGAKVLITSLKYSISNAGVSVCEASLQQTPAYADAVETVDPAFDSNLVWELVNTRTVFDEGDHKNGKEVIETDGLTDYVAADAPDYTPTRPGIREKVRSRWLRYKTYHHSSGFLWSSQQSWTSTHNYEEYFISKNRQQ